MAIENQPTLRKGRRYSPEEKVQVVRLGSTLRDELGYGVESVRSWVKQADVDDGLVGGTTTSDKKRITELEQEVRELRRANEMFGCSLFGGESVQFSSGVDTDAGSGSLFLSRASTDNPFAHCGVHD